MPGTPSRPGTAEIFIHHAVIPLALFLLLRDYRFVLLDACVRLLANAPLAAILTGLVIAAAFRLVLVERVAPDPSKEALLLISVCLFLVFFAWLRNRVQELLTQVVFRHGDLAELAGSPKTHRASNPANNTWRGRRSCWPRRYRPPNSRLASQAALSCNGRVQRSTFREHVASHCYLEPPTTGEQSGAATGR